MSMSILLVILSIVRGDFKRFFGKKTKTCETWKTECKPNILEGKFKEICIKRKKKKKRQQDRKHTRKKKWKKGMWDKCLTLMIF